jgi:hypothetical protein
MRLLRAGQRGAPPLNCGVMRQVDLGGASPPAEGVSLPTCLLVFSVLGLFIGLIVVLVALIAMARGVPPTKTVAFVGISGLVIWGLPTTFAALLTGLAYWAFPSAICATRIRAAVASASVGLATCASVAVVISGGFDTLLTAGTWLLFLAPGATAAAACALVLERRKRRVRFAQGASP